MKSQKRPKPDNTILPGFGKFGATIAFIFAVAFMSFVLVYLL